MATITTIKKNTQTPGKAGVQFREFLFLCLRHWQWFIISLIICMLGAYLYLKRTAPVYQRTASVMIKTDSSGKTISSNNGMFEDLGISQGNTIYDEMALIDSPDLMREVVRRLNLNIQYILPGTFRDIELYGSTLPVTVQLPDLTETDYASFKLDVNKNGDYTISDISKGGKLFAGKVVKGRIGVPAKSPLGTIVINPAKDFSNQQELSLTVNYIPVKQAAKRYNGALTLKLDEEAENIVDMAITDPSPDKATDLLRELISVYNDRWMKDKRELADNSSKFIDERIQLIQHELGNVDNDISSFKSANLVPDVDAAASMYMSQATQANMALKDLRNQEYMAKYIRNYLRNSANDYKLLPTNAGIANMNISAQIGQYNTKILERNSLVNQSSTSNPLVNDMDAGLEAMRQALIASIDNELVSLSEQIKSQEGFSGQATSHIASNPSQAKYLLSVERQQKVKETLYLYLLQKREENQLNQAITSYNTRIIEEVDGPGGPVSPDSGKVYLIAFVIGLAFPALVLYGKELSVSVIRGRRDIKSLKVPFAGELPFEGEKKKWGSHVGKHKESAVVAVKENSRNAINEAFRVVRTNVEFMNGNDPHSVVLMVTSANPGSGKTYVTFNLAKSFSIKNKRVIAIDLDLRKASLSKYVDNTKYGVADYLANRINDIDEIIQPVEDAPNMSIIPVGTLPPNPTELLFSDRLHALIEDLRNHYDYVFIDCPPVEVVADASIISKYVDRTLFIVRAGLLRLDMLPVVEEFYENNTYPNMSLILNGTINPKNSYARRYGNPYSYGYGYGSSYRYTNDK